MSLRTTLLLPTILSIILFGGLPAETQAQPTTCAFMLGFRTLRDLMPEVVGDCVEDEWYDQDRRETRQQTIAPDCAVRPACLTNSLDVGFRDGVNRLCAEPDPSSIPGRHFDPSEHVQVVLRAHCGPRPKMPAAPPYFTGCGHALADVGA